MLKTLSLPSLWPSFAKAPAGKPQSFSKTKPGLVAKATPANSNYYLALTLIAACALLLLSYIYGVNDFASKGYQIKVLQAKVSALNEDNTKINLKVSEAGSMVQIQNGFLSSNFVP